MKIIRLMLSAVLLGEIALSGMVSAGEAGPHSYTLGVVPQFEQRKLYAIWQPIIDALEKETGLAFKLVTTLKINDFEKEYMAEQFDFAYMNPYFIVRGVVPGTYIPIIRDNKPHRGIIVVRKDGPVRNIADLAGRTVAFPAPNAIGATLMTRSELERFHGVTVVPLFVKSHSSVYLHVAKGLADAGGGVEKTLQEQDAAIRDTLTVLYRTQAMPNLPVAAHRRVPAEVREKVQRAFLALGRTEEGRALLAKVPMTEITAASLEEYLIIEKWGLEKYWNPLWSD